jgi:hypothetical protein
LFKNEEKWGLEVMWWIMMMKDNVTLKRCLGFLNNVVAQKMW